jgi:hypothetical protein
MGGRPEGALGCAAPRIITTMARDQRDHAKDGDVLVDDMLKHRRLREEVGGVFVHHTSAEARIDRSPLTFL